MNILFIGSSGPLSLYPLNTLLSSGHSICAIAMEITQTNPFYNPLFPISTNTNDLTSTHLDSFAQNNNVPVIIFDKPLEHYLSNISLYSPDIIIVSCFGKKLPQCILTIPKYGCFNLHPSLLPDFRGPTPIFWQFRNGARKFGVSLHRMTDHFDSGDIIKQSSIEFEDGIHHQQAKLLLSELAADLVVDVVNNFENSINQAACQHQSLAHYYSYPSSEDYEVNTNWTARRIYNFIKAYAGENILFPCNINGKIFYLLNAIDYNNQSATIFELTDDQVTFSCARGTITASIQIDH